MTSDVLRPPLDGLRVLELATGVAGPYAGRLFAMLGATVVKAEPAGGDPARRMQVDHQPLTGTSPLYVHLNVGKRSVDEANLDMERAVEWANVVIADRIRRDVTATPLDPSRLAGLGGPRVLATTSAWGFEADDAGEPQDELLVQAASGMLTPTIELGGQPMRFPGWQTQYLAGVHLAAASLALFLNRGAFAHVDVPWFAAALVGIENDVALYLHRASVTPHSTGQRHDDTREQGIQGGAFPAGVFRCADGFVIPGTVRPIDWQLQCEVYGRPDLVTDDRFRARNRAQHRDALMAEIQPWYDARTKREIFLAALDHGWAAAMVMTGSDLLDDPHISDRGFLTTVEVPDTPSRPARVAGRPWRATNLAEVSTRLARAHEDTDWFSRELSLPRVERNGVDLSKLKVVELTWAWAGPFVGRFLASFGADVIRIETGRYPDGWRARGQWKDVGVPVPNGIDPEHWTWDASAMFNGLNRGKRSVSVDLSHPDGRNVFLDLVRMADVLVLNMTHHVLSQHGVERDVMAAVPGGLVVINMPMLGATGPYRSMPGYGSLAEGMGGFAARFGRADEGARNTNSYYPDPVAGAHAALAALSGLFRRANLGPGSYIDLSQQEVTWLQLAEAVVLASTDGRDPDRLGDAEPGVASSGIRDSGGGGWVAFVDDREQEVVTFRRAFRDGTLAAQGLIEQVEHPVTGTRWYVGSPLVVDGERLRSPSPAPMFAVHTDEVLREWLGYDGARVAKLRDAGAIGTVPDQPARRSAP